MKIETLVRDFLAVLHGRQGRFARANGSFFSAQVVSTAFHQLRLALMDGAVLNHRGQQFVRGGAAYLAWLAHRNFRQRGVQLSHEIDLDTDEPRLLLHAWRQREDHEEHYLQDVLADTEALLLHPPEHFPALHGHFHHLSSLNMPTPEYLYLYGVCLMQSARAEGNWPHGEQDGGFAGGLDADFELSRRLLVDDLHHDAALPKDDMALRQLSQWVVFPPCGWPMNEGQCYNLMTLIDQIAIHPQLPAEQAIAYLQALLYTQMAFVRHLAARALMVLDIAPRDAVEAAFYQQALQADDAPQAIEAMAEQRLKLESSFTETPEDWSAICWQYWQALISQAPPARWQQDPILQESAWQHASTLGIEHGATAMRIFHDLQQHYPDSWLLRVAMASQQLWDADSAAEGEATLRQCLEDNPDCPSAHLALINYWQGRDEALPLCQHAVARWPWDLDVVKQSMWLLVSGLVGTANEKTKIMAETEISP